MEKKVILVTGANCGIGLLVVKDLCELGHDVVISVRDDDKGEAAISAIKQSVPGAEVMYLTMELSEPQSIRDFVSKFLETGKKLNILVNNAGMFKAYSCTDRVIARGDPSLEITMTVNCMGPFLLTNLLLDELKANGTKENPSRIVNVSSGLTKRSVKGVFYVDDLMLEQDGHYASAFQSYRNSKLAMNLWSVQLAEQLEECNVVINTVCPGYIPNTELARENTATWSGSILMKILDSFIGKMLAKTQPVEVGKKRVIEMTVTEDKNTSGQFYEHDVVTTEAEEVLNQENRDKIWGLCVKYSGL